MKSGRAPGRRAGRRARRALPVSVSAMLVLMAVPPPADGSESVDAVDELDAMLIFGEISEDAYIRARKRRVSRG